MRVLLLGATGQLCHELRRALMPLGEVIATARSTTPPQGLRTLDITDTAALEDLLEEICPQVVVNASAYTAVDQAETGDTAAAHATNATAVGNLGEAARKLGAVVLHYSTDYVFDGRASVPYREGDPPAPINEYGRSKLAGERALQQSGCAALVLRTSWLYGARGHNFVLTMLRLRHVQPRLSVVNDQRGSPTWSRPLAEATAQLLAQSRIHGLDWLAQHAGIYHVAAEGSCTWFDFARHLLWRAGERVDDARIVPISSQEFARPAPRPAYSVLDCGLFHQVFGLRLPRWQTQIDALMEDLGHPGVAH